MVRQVNSLYRTEEQIAEDVLGPGSLIRWRSLAMILERQGMPQIDPLMGGRYGPAVKAFFDRRAGLSERTVPSRADQPESYKCLPSSSSTAKASRPGTLIADACTTGVSNTLVEP